MQGLIVFDWADRIPEAISQLGAWHKDGKLKIREDVRDERARFVPGCAE